MSRVAVEELEKVYANGRQQPIHALRSVSFAAGPDEILVIAGPSGSGKSTLLRLIAGLDQPDAGQVYLDGKAVNAVEAGERDVAMVFQSPALYPEMTVRENLAFGLRVRKVPRGEREQRLREVAGLLNIGDTLDRRPMELSGGQRQRAALARALVRRPGLLLLDEPLSSLDGPTRSQLRGELARIQRELRGTMIYVTHDQVDAMTLANRLLILMDGMVKQLAPPREVYDRPASLAVAAFLGSPPMNLWRGQLVQQHGVVGFYPDAMAGGGEPWLSLTPQHTEALRLRIGAPLVLGIRPEHVTPCLALSDAQYSTTVSGLVTHADTTGAESWVRVKAGLLEFDARVPNGMLLQPNQVATMQFDMARAHFFDAATGEAIACEC